MPKILNIHLKNTFTVLLTLLISHQLSGQSVLYRVVSFTKAMGSSESFLERMEEQTDVVFSYSSELCMEEEVVLMSQSATIREVLDQLFANCSAEYIVNGRKIIIKPLTEANRKFVVRGYVKDVKTRETLIQANVFETDRLLGTVSNNFGFYSLTLPAGHSRLTCSYVGYEMAEQIFNLRSDTVIDFSLKSSARLDQIDVVRTKVPNRVKSARTGTIDLPIDQIRNVPVFLGEVDVVKSIQLLPGVQSGGEGLSALYVRGGGPDQNLVLMDDVPVYNVGHVFGFFSIFNADAVNHVSVVKGGFPARYGGRLSSVIDIRLYDGNDQEFKSAASIGLLSGRVAVEGPLVKDKSSFSVSLRRTYLDLFTSLIQLNENDKSRYYFYDFNTKFNLKVNERNRLYFSSYLGKDQYGLQYNTQNIQFSDGADGEQEQNATTYDESDVGWKNFIMAARWNHIFRGKMFANTILSYSDYRFFIGQNINYQDDGVWNVISQNYYSGIRDYTIKSDWDYYPDPNHKLRFGANFTGHEFYPGIDLYLRENASSEPVDTTFGGEKIYRPELRLYVEDDFHLSDRIRLNLGAHFSVFQTESKRYWSLEPRLSARYLISDHMSVKVAYSQMSQYIHLLRTASVAMPTDMWLPVSDNIRPMRAAQTAVGIEYDFSNGFSLSVEGYYKTLRDILAYKESTGYFDFTSDWRNKLTNGDGESRGIELLIHKKAGTLSGWIGYTYSKTTNQFEELNNGDPFPADFDRTHDVSLFAMYKFNDRVDLSGTWTFGTGSPITLPETKYYAPSLPTEEHETGSSGANNNQYIRARNSYRMPNFHRLDIGVNFKKDKSYGSRVWSFGIMNAYGRQNPFFLYFSDSETEDGQKQRSLRQFSLFPLPIPYARYTIRF